MKKYLITGFSGFVSQYFLKYLDERGVPARVLGVDILSPGFDYKKYNNITCDFERIDLLDKNQVDNLLYQFQPDYILHLASYSSVAFSWKDPVTSYRNNTNIFLNLLEQVRHLDLDCRVLSVGSSEEYGNVREEDVPLLENRMLNPCSPYAAARVSQEQLSRIYVDGYGLDIVLTRSFNHIGPGQRDVFAVASFARQLVEMKKAGKTSGVLYTGDVSVVRDFLDVRDVVASYYLLFEKGENGEVYNICSGSGISLNDVIIKLADIVGLEITVERKEKLIRPLDNKIIVGSNEKLKKTTGWSQNITLLQSLTDIIKDWEEKI